MIPNADLDILRARLDRVEIRRAAYGSYPWHAVDPVTGEMIGLPPSADDVVELHGQRHYAIDLLWPVCFVRKRDVRAGLERYREWLDEIEAASCP